MDLDENDVHVNVYSIQYMQYFANLKISSIWISNISILFWQLYIPWPAISKGCDMLGSVVYRALTFPINSKEGNLSQKFISANRVNRVSDSDHTAF